MTVKSLRKQLAAAIAMTLVATVALGSSTYAWFSLNNTVTATGMQVRTTVAENLLISGDTLGSTERKADDTFATSLVQGSDVLLEPVSTVNGKAFFYTAGTNVKGNGDAINDTYGAYNAAEVPTDAELTAFRTAYGDAATAGSAVGYVDYVFQIKAINGSTASEICLTQLDLIYGGASPANNNKAYRVAMFVENLGYKTSTDNSELKTPAGGAGTLTTIFTPASAANFETGKAVTSTTATGAVTYCANTTTAKIGSVQANATSYYKVVFRLWLEGEDNTCNNTTYMDLKEKWSLDLKFELKPVSDATDCVQNISQLYTAIKASLNVGDAVGTAMVVDSTTYYAITGKTLGSEQLYKAADAPVAADDHIYIIVNNHPYEVTNQVTISPATP